MVPQDDPDPNGGGEHQVEVKVLDGGHAGGTQHSIHPVVEWLFLTLVGGRWCWYLLLEIGLLAEVRLLAEVELLDQVGLLAEVDLLADVELLCEVELLEAGLPMRSDFFLKIWDFFLEMLPGRCLEAE